MEAQRNHRDNLGIVYKRGKEEAMPSMSCLWQQEYLGRELYGSCCLSLLCNRLTGMHLQAQISIKSGDPTQPFVLIQ